VLVWLSVWSEVQIVCIWSGWCQCHPKTTSSLASFKSRLVLPFWYCLTQVVLEKGLLNGCSVVISNMYCYVDSATWKLSAVETCCSYPLRFFGNFSNCRWEGTLNNSCTFIFCCCDLLFFCWHAKLSTDNYYYHLLELEQCGFTCLSFFYINK